MSAVISNNVLMISNTPFLIEDMVNGTVSGQNNWFMMGSNPGTLTGLVFGANPMFGTAYRLAAGSPCIGAAASIMNAPGTEYYYDER